MTDKNIQNIINRRNAYRRLFLDEEGKLNQDGELVINDLARFCRLYKSVSIISMPSRQTDVPATFQAEGRREVMLRILANFYTDDSYLFRLTNKEAFSDE